MRVEVSDVSVTFGDRTVLDRLSLVIDSGESVALVGPSGSGKSTLLATIGGIQRPDGGTVDLDPESGSNRVAWILQTVSVLPNRTVLDNVILGGHQLRLDHGEARERARQAVAAVGLELVMNQPAKSVSGGERQRVVVARSVVGDPGLILADEPTAQLDESNAQTVTEALLVNRPEHATVILATHDLKVARQCDRLVSLRGGKLVE